MKLLEPIKESVAMRDFPSPGCMRLLPVSIACSRRMNSTARDDTTPRGKEDQKMPSPFPKPAARGADEDTAMARG